MSWARTRTKLESHLLIKEAELKDLSTILLCPDLKLADLVQNDFLCFQRIHSVGIVYFRESYF